MKRRMRAALAAFRDPRPGNGVRVELDILQSDGVPIPVLWPEQGLSPEDRDLVARWFDAVRHRGEAALERT